MKIRQSLKIVTAKQTNKKHETVVQLALTKSTITNFVEFTVKKLCARNQSVLVSIKVVSTF